MSTPTDERVARLPKWAREYIEGLEARAVRSETPLRIEAGVVQGFVLTRSEMRSFKMVEEASIRRDILRARRERP